MTSVKFDYVKFFLPRINLLRWVNENGGVIIRASNKHGYLGKILSVEFEDEVDAVAFRLMTGM
jgi:hypothetical protein